MFPSNEKISESILPPSERLTLGTVNPGNPLPVIDRETHVPGHAPRVFDPTTEATDDYFDNLPRPQQLFGLDPSHLVYVSLDIASAYLVSTTPLFSGLTKSVNIDASVPATCAALFAMLVVLGCAAQNGYGILTTSMAKEDVRVVLQASAIGTIFNLILVYLFAIRLGTMVQMVLIGLGTAVLMLSWRHVFRMLARRSIAGDRPLRNVVIVGESRLAIQVAAYLNRHQRLGRRVKGLIGETLTSQVPVLGTLESLPILLRKEFIDEVIVAEPLALDKLEDLISQARSERFDLKAIPELFVINWHPRMERMGVLPMVALHREPAAAVSRTIKRILDVVLSCIALFITAPLMLVVAGIIKWDSPGPVLFCSPRIGQKGMAFPCLKFRTMVENAEALKSHLAHLNERDSILFKVSSDPRMTKVGQFFRKYSIDELPQFWNVLCGDMSIVGPRPPLAEEVARYDSVHLRRLSVRPGITGLWQVNARKHPSFESYILYDFEYIENWSLALDLRIMLKTIEVVLEGSGS